MKHTFNDRKNGVLMLLCALVLTLTCILCACGGNGNGEETTVAETTGADPAETTGEADVTDPSETTGADENATTAPEETTTPEDEPETTEAATKEEETSADPLPSESVIKTDKHDYILGETINIKACTSDLKWTINVYPADFVPGTDPALYWAYFEGAEGQDKTIVADKYLSLLTYPGTNKGNEKADPFYGKYLPSGDYKIVILDPATAEVKVSADITILPPQTVENVNLALSAPVCDTSSSFEWAPYCSASYLNDGTDAGWASDFNRNTTPYAEEYITIDLLDVYIINRVLLTPQVFWNNTTVFPEDYAIQVSIDGDEYTTVASVTGDNDFDESVRVIDFEPVEAVYVRLLCTKLRQSSSVGIDDYQVEVDEMEVYYATDDSMVPAPKPATGIVTDKKVYLQGETVNINVLSTNLTYSINLYPAAFTPGTDPFIYRAYLEGNEGQTNVIALGKYVNVAAMGEDNRGNEQVDAYYGDSLPTGEYKLCLIDEATGEIIFTATFAVAEKPVDYSDAPMWDGDKAVVVHQSFDELRVNSDPANGVFAPGASNDWSKNALLPLDTQNLFYWGWIGAKGELGQFGYQIDSDKPVFKDDFTHTTEDAVVKAASDMGAEVASRMAIVIDVAGMTGAHTVHVLYKTANGTVVKLNEFRLTLANTELPATYLATDKNEYTVGETVNIIAKGEEGDVWVAVYDKDGIVGTTPTFRWSYLEGLSEGATVIPQGVFVDILSLPGNNIGNGGNPTWYDETTDHMPAGEYKVLLINAAGVVLLEVPFKVV